MDTHTDTDWAGDKASRKSIGCVNHQMDGCPIMSTVRQQSFLALSSAEAELGGMLIGGTEGLAYRRLLEWLGFKVIWKLGTDSSAARGFAFKEGVGRMRHIDLKILWLQRATATEGLNIYKVPGELNRANLGTKRLAQRQLEQEARMNGILDISEVGRQSVPEVHAVERVGMRPDLATLEELSMALLTYLRTA